MPTPLTGSFLFFHKVGLWVEGQGGVEAAMQTPPLPPLSADFHYVAMDFGGHGLSSHYKPGLLYNHQNFVSEVRRVAAGEREPLSAMRRRVCWGMLCHTLSS